MNNALKEIAAKYGVSEEKIPEILSGMKIKDAQKPSKPQLEGFEKICIMLQEGKPMAQALVMLLDEAKNGRAGKETSTNTPNAEEIDSFILTQAQRAADATLASLPQIAVEEHQRLKELFVQRYRQRIAQQLQDPEFRQQFQLAIEGQQMGKFNFLNSMTSNIALPSSSSSNS
ncbi:hypothetical protein [Chroococcidiopsis sp. CCMEE 29]|uniref:hypothetical protein n=1 Tax=Chroococcidiopsis sp. CCMEE 29 TaxID=155894 RepID=UPI002020EB4A|nr:hypothetical protein [Chroococcidiopsis sp. CCMEE 29]